MASQKSWNNVLLDLSIQCAVAAYLAEKIRTKVTGKPWELDILPLIEKKTEVETLVRHLHVMLEGIPDG